jgi:2-dehydro-3-deoxy-D-arabinonate dehydratase
VTLLIGMPQPSEVGISLLIRRSGSVAFAGKTSVGQMARTFDDLVGYLGRDNTFPRGAILLTGTGIVPEDDFTLRPGDLVEITIDGIGTLINPVMQV